MGVKLANNATAKISANLSPIDGQVVLQSGHGQRFPALDNGDWFPMTLVRADGSLEITHATGRNEDIITVDRGQEGTQAKEFHPGDVAELRITAGSLTSISDGVDEVQQSLNALSDSLGDAAFVDIGQGPQQVPTNDIVEQMVDGKVDGAVASVSQAVSDALAAVAAQQVGTIVYRTGTEPMDDEVVADGSVLQKAEYPELWAYAENSGNLGSGDGHYEDVDTDTFRVPDLRDYFLRAQGDGRSIGSTQQDQNKSHSHSGSTGSAGGHSHSVPGSMGTQGNNTGFHRVSQGSPTSLSTDSVGNHSHSVNIGSSGGAEARPKNIAYLPCIKTGKPVVM